jgi:hypothetical protein
VNKGVEHLPELRQTMAASNERYLSDFAYQTFSKRSITS